MATWDAAYCLALFNRLTGRPTADAITSTTKYQMLSEAQNEIIADVAAICPSVLYPSTAYTSLPTMTTTDSQVFTFGTDANGYSIAPIGRTWIGPDLSSLLDDPWREGVDYIKSGANAIRIPNNGTYTGTVYWFGITNPADIDATHQPVLFPEASRELIAIKAAYNFATEGNRNAELAAVMAGRYAERFPRWCLTWRTQYRQGGAMGGITGMQLAIGGSYNGG